jgi:DNA repair protein RadC
MKVRDLPELDRPRERLLHSGASVLSDRELLALLLGSGLAGTDAIELAAELIADAGGLRSLAVADPHALKQRPGVGAAKAARVAAAFELARRAVRMDERRRISGSSDVALVAAPYLRGRRHERVVVVVCDNSGGVLRVAALTDGAADRSLVPVREVLATVLATGGTRFALAHNHPSGSVEPSAADVEVTGRLRAAAETVGLRFLDHVIVTETEWARVP